MPRATKPTYTLEPDHVTFILSEDSGESATVKYSHIGRPCRGVYAARNVQVWPPSSTIDVMLSTDEGVGKFDPQFAKIPHWAITTITSLALVVVSVADAEQLM